MTKFASVGVPVEVAVIVVTYDSAAVIDNLIASVRRATRGISARLVVVDNESTDDTRQRVSAHGDVQLVRPGANTGYAGGINAARAHLGVCESVLVLNPDLVLAADAVHSMLGHLIDPVVGVVVPRLVDESGTTYTSIRREPSLLSATIDAMVGSHVTRRPEWSSETLYNRWRYEYPQDIEWSTGAALLVRRDVMDAVGEWDEQFFLYSEETDFFRRTRDRGWTVMYDPAAHACHHGGGSGTSTALTSLMAVNRVKYIEKYHSAFYALAFLIVVVLSEAVRGNHGTARMVANREAWPSLPRRTLPRRPDMGSIVVPAHDESSVITRTLVPLGSLAAEGIVEILVVCNGCSDDTAERARAIEGVRVIEIETASKVAALNAGDASATLWPRIYLDADVVLTADAAVEVLTSLSEGRVLAARPSSTYAVDDASFWVRRYYAARSRIPSFRHALWGAGCYALSEDGHRRLGSFPDVIADDVHVDNQFDAIEKRSVVTDPVVISVPRDVRSLVTVLNRNYRGNAGVEANTVVQQSIQELIGHVRGPVSFLDAATYAAFALAGRVVARRSSDAGWQRDLSSR
ncbi:hypothetical protein GCM10007304_00430 [Rhodococcoides trifolii]|uniref:Glycosyltransferase 2-like domain-containing protein n=1 Tax=Rhodococcoides trifolii TaxID=908250 RepID=A0A917CLS3_9NOCA|nr:glycosyltransferase family 2 protein [Rhodococcus trifolii]GGF90449.1 hypothetical protein GCM10007304_00430 [Rhodococcus trifolii]